MLNLLIRTISAALFATGAATAPAAVESWTRDRAADVQAERFDFASLSASDLRNVRGDFGGVRVPELALRCPEEPSNGIRCVGDNGNTARGVVAGAIFGAADAYTPAQRKQFFDLYTDGPGVHGKPRDYTHLPVGPFAADGCRDRWYHAIFPPPRDCSGPGRNTLLREMIDHRVGDVARPIVPICFVMGESDATVKLPDGFDKALCRYVSPKWEVPHDVERDLRAVRAAFPDAFLAWHNPARNDEDGPAGHDYPHEAAKETGGPRAWYARMHTDPAIRLDGVLLQTNPWSRDVGKTADVIRDVRALLPPTMDLVLFETDIYVKFWDGFSEAESVAYNDAVLRQAGVAAMVRGFASGSTNPRQAAAAIPVAASDRRGGRALLQSPLDQR